MPTALTLVEIALVGLLVVITFLLGLFFARRQAISRHRSLFVCGWRPTGADEFVAGMASLDGGTLTWFRLNGLSWRPSRTWERSELDLSGATRISVPELAAILPDALGVTCHSGAQSFELAVPEACYAALRSWVESIPPGHNVNVA